MKPAEKIAAASLVVGLLVLLYRNRYAAAVATLNTISSKKQMKISQQGIDKLKTREGFSASRYKDAKGYSIGYGHFLKPSESHITKITAQQAETFLRDDLTTAEGAVNAYISAPMLQHEFDAFVSFCYNVGVGGFRISDVRKQFNAGNKAKAAASFSHFITSQGKILDALIKRRESERAQFEGKK